jgi:hypothetical protein
MRVPADGRLARMHTRPLAYVLALLSVTTLVASLAPVAQAMCAMEMPYASIVTPISEPLPKNGSLLVRVELGTSPEGMAVTALPNGSYRLPDLALVQGETRIPISVTDLRAGLMRLSFASEPSEGDYELVGITEQGLGIRIGGTLPAAPTAPLVSSAVHQERVTSREGHRGEERITSWTTRVALTHRLPSSIKLAAIRPSGRAGAWQLFESVGGETTFENAGSLGGHCSGGFLPGRGRAWHDMNAELVTIDRYGRVSPPSAPFRVR